MVSVNLFIMFYTGRAFSLLSGTGKDWNIWSAFETAIQLNINLNE